MENLSSLHRSIRSINGAIILGVKAADFPPNEFNHYLTRHETARLLHVDLKTVYTWARQGKLKAHRFGHRVFFERHELIRSVFLFNL